MVSILKSKVQITQDEYNKLLQCSQVEIHDYISEIANKSTYPPCGYGFFSPCLCKEGENYFVSWEHLNSCD